MFLIVTENCDGFFDNGGNLRPLQKQKVSIYSYFVFFLIMCTILFFF
jgi:hypothetical protein